MSAVLVSVADVQAPGPVRALALVKAKPRAQRHASFFAGPIVTEAGFARLTLLDAEPAPEPPCDPSWGKRLIMTAANFRTVAPGPVWSEFSARPSGAHDSPAWARYVTALQRWIAGRTSANEVAVAMVYEREAVRSVVSAWRDVPQPSPRYRAARATKCAPVPTFTPRELATAARIIESKCDGPLLERAWLELKSPSRRCKVIFPRLRGRVDYAANAAVCVLNSNSIGLT